MQSNVTVVKTGTTDINKLKANDLQIAKIATGSNAENALMTHQMSLAKITLKYKAGVVTTKNYTWNTSTNTANITNSGTTNLMASNVFSTSAPYVTPYYYNTESNQEIYYFIAKYNEKPQLLDNDATEYKKWSSAITIQNNSKNPLGKGIYATFTATSRAENRTWCYYVAEFPYQEEHVQTFNVPVTGTYILECWGAEGGNSGAIIGGQGAYTKGTIALGGDKASTIYAYVGGKGGCNGVPTPAGHSDINANPRTITNSRIRYAGGWNGGGKGGTDGDFNHTTLMSNGNISGNGLDAGGGGGATDFRLQGGAWNNSSSLQSRIMVAAGAGGGMGMYSPRDANCHTASNASHGGGLWGYNGQYTSPASTSTPPYLNNLPDKYVYGGTQSNGGTPRGFAEVGSNFANADAWSAGGAAELNGKLGEGGCGNYNVHAWAGGGGGGGYYGGSGGVSYYRHYSGHSTTGGGGSSFIPGHIGCASSVIYGGKSYSFISESTLMIDGYGLKWTTTSAPDNTAANRATMPNPDGSATTTAYNQTATGRLGNGFARITFVSE